LRDVRNAGGPGIGIAKQGQKLSYGGLSRQFAFGEMRTNASIKKVAKPRPLLPRDLSYLNDYPEVDRYISQSGLHYWINLAVREGLRKSQFYDLGNKLIVAADLAMDMRHAEGLEQTSRILTSALLPEEFQRIGQYYQALYLRVRGNVAASLALLTDLAESSATPLRYRARAMLAIAAHFSGIGNMDEALPFYLEAGYAASPRHGNDLYTTTGSQWMAAVAKGLNGDHRGALMDLERLLPSVQMVASVRPFYYFSYRNSLAVEQAELGQLEKAQHNIRVALGSPFAPNRPEWRETAEDVARKARRDIRSVVAINSDPPALS
ncbi:MAG TPA: hypothetical protein VNO14_00825, partial [Blastocatellia bacterium]|nr:hypothetical protein [Blastocatellia bacterium]